MLELVCGTDKMAFSVESEEIPAAPRYFTRLSQASAENARSRIYLGVHWSFDDTEGRAMGRKVADQVFMTHFAPVVRTARNHGRLEIVWPSTFAELPGATEYGASALQVAPHGGCARRSGRAPNDGGPNGRKLVLPAGPADGRGSQLTVSQPFRPPL